ncbi:hypothetical protein V7S43_015491 [Phytophthora oleae]|uniref:Uncharacterized protein n=1 Tax=Phytophthora oleae TaxID=2107226 RepID=A0ABD3F295_9STRA
MPMRSVKIRHLIEELRKPTGLEQPKQHRRDAQLAANAVNRMEKIRNEVAGSSEWKQEIPAATASEDNRLDPTKKSTTAAWLEKVARFEEQAPVELTEDGTLTEMRAARRVALKKAKRFRLARRLRL